MTAVANGGERSSMFGSLTFAMKIGLIRESVRVELAAYGSRLTAEMLRDIAFAFLDRNVCTDNCFLDKPLSANCELTECAPGVKNSIGELNTTQQEIMAAGETPLKSASVLCNSVIKNIITL